MIKSKIRRNSFILKIILIILILSISVGFHSISSGNYPIDRIFINEQSRAKKIKETAKNKSDDFLAGSTTYMAAIIIDDVGADMTNFTELMNIPCPLTISILPGLRFSSICGEIATQKGHEVMLHQPMQPKDQAKNRIGPLGIKVGMKPSMIYQILFNNIDSIPHVRGVNNHMGSLATSRSSVMIPVVEAIKKRNLYFIDSVTAGTSIAYRTALDHEVKSLKRDLFIDSESGLRFATSQMRKILPLAKRKGRTIVIGHCRKSTIEAIILVLPELQKRGIKFVTVSELFEK